MSNPLYPGMEFPIQYELLDGVTPIPLSSLTNVLVWVYHADGTILRKFAMNALAGHDSDDFNIVDDAAGQFEVVLRSAITSLAKVGDYKNEIKIQISASGYKSVGVAKVFTFEDAKTNKTLV